MDLEIRWCKKAFLIRYIIFMFFAIWMYRKTEAASGDEGGKTPATQELVLKPESVINNQLTDKVSEI